ncbi:hypothetical protein PR048_027528 [Dryococelus australis]|uniref:Uncharacterized protein n=1 Tax=Dryococelus australis TaxID=614101 RepID=A0ABQ9GGT6_9NEOP|nr:hypothetical protein PR048_027528 [Dryococelus australis]
MCFESVVILLSRKSLCCSNDSWQIPAKVSTADATSIATGAHSIHLIKLSLLSPHPLVKPLTDFIDLINNCSMVTPLAFHQWELGSIPGRYTLDFHKFELCWVMLIVGGFSRGSPVFPAPSSECCTMLTIDVHILRTRVHTTMVPASITNTLSESMIVLSLCAMVRTVQFLNFVLIQPPHAYSLWIHVGRGFIHDEDPVVPDDGTRKTDKLPLSCAEVTATRFHLSIVMEPSTFASRNKAEMREDFPAPVRPTMPTCERHIHSRMQLSIWVAVLQWSDYLAPTEANRVRIPAASLGFSYLGNVADIAAAQ